MKVEFKTRKYLQPLLLKETHRLPEAAHLRDQLVQELLLLTLAPVHRGHPHCTAISLKRHRQNSREASQFGLNIGLFSELQLVEII